MGRIFWNKKQGTYTNNNSMYLVDLMFMYVNDGNIVSRKIRTNKLFPQLSRKGWGNVSPLQVIKNKNVFMEDYIKIKKADLRYPIMLDTKLNIIDGAHRLSKAYILDKKYIRAYVFNGDIMKKFMISKKKGSKWTKNDWKYYESLTKRDVEELYKERFMNPL